MERYGIGQPLKHYGHIKNVLDGTVLTRVYVTCAPESEIDLKFLKLMS